MNKDEMAGQRQLLLDALISYLGSAEEAAWEWQDKAKKAWDMVHGRIDWSHKQPDQSRVHLDRVGHAQRQFKAVMRQGLMNFDDWLSVENEVGFESDYMDTNEAKRLVWRLIDRTDPKQKIAENLGIAAIENLLATKLRPIVVEKRGPGGKIKKELHVDHVILNIRNYYPDPQMAGLFEFHESTMDKYKVLELSSDSPTDLKPYRKDAVEKLQPATRKMEPDEQQDRGNDIQVKPTDRRKGIVLHEFWGTVLTPDGEIMVWKNEDGSELELKDVVITMANRSEIIADPKRWPSFDGESYFIATSLMHTNVNPYGRAPLAAGVDMNRAEDELMNVGIDAALKEGLNINTLKTHGLADKKQASGGVKYGVTLLQNNQLAPGEKLLDTVSTGKVPQGLLTLLAIVKGAGSENMDGNDLSISGAMPGAGTKATTVVAANNTIQGLAEAVGADLEDVYVERYARKVFCIGLQYANMLDDYDLKYIFYGDEQRAAKFKELAKKPKNLYEELSCCFRFRGKGVRSLAVNQATAQAVVNIASMIVSNPLIHESFQLAGYNLALMFEDVYRGFHLDMNKYKSAATAEFASQRLLIREAALRLQEAQSGQGGQPQQQAGGPSAPGIAATQPSAPGANPSV